MQLFWKLEVLHLTANVQTRRMERQQILEHLLEEVAWELGHAVYYFPAKKHVRHQKHPA
jgi:uncharacterized protein (UPF0303 family)